MKHVVPPIVALLFAAVLMAPSFVLLQFKLDQARIARELCVQRDLLEDMRSCHGECQLGKRLKALERDAEQDFPTERVRVRYEPMVEQCAEPVAFIRPALVVVLPEMLFPLADGYGRCLEHVPKG
jgi:hypothetical protein